MSSTQRLELHYLTLQLHSPENVRVARHQCFSFDSRKHHIVHVFDDAHGDRAAKDCLEPASFGLDRLEHVSVEAPRGQIDEDANPSAGINCSTSAIKDRTI